MGLDANCPAMRINDPAARRSRCTTRTTSTSVRSGLLTVVYSAATYIKCITKAWDDAWWYRMMIPANYEPSAASAWVSAGEKYVVERRCQPSRCLEADYLAAGAGHRLHDREELLDVAVDATEEEHRPLRGSPKRWTGSAPCSNGTLAACWRPMPCTSRTNSTTRRRACATRSSLGLRKSSAARWQNAARRVVGLR
jgi:hypothetical protein